MMKRLLAGILGIYALTGFADTWYRITPAKAIEIVSKADGQDSGEKKPGKGDDRVLIDFMDYHFDKERLTDIESSGDGFRGKLRIKEAEFTVNSSIEKLGERKIRLHWSMNGKAPAEFGESFFSIGMNRNMLGRNIRFRPPATVLLPVEKEGWVWSAPARTTIKEINIPMNKGTLKISGFSDPGNGTAVSVIKYGKDYGNIRIFQSRGAFSELKLTLDIEFIPYTASPLNLADTANMGFKDETENDGKGGWTDQGPDNDLRQLKAGKETFGAVTFDILDPDRNGGKSCMVFANRQRPNMLKAATVPVGGKACDYLYLLHATAWNKKGAEAGRIVVNYTDGSREELKVICDRDVSNWWEPKNCDNAAVVWRTQNRSSLVGLYMSRFALSGKPVKELVFHSGQESVWAVVAASVMTGKEIPFSFAVEREIPFVIKADKEWKTFTYPNGVEPGSALDFAFMTGDQAAGHLGKLQVTGDQFVFEKAPERPVRFFGGNLCADGTVMNDAELEYFPRRLKQLGYNAVRLHHFDNLVVKAGDKLTFDPVNLDRFFKTFATLKKNGLYVTIDLYISRLNGFEDGAKHNFNARKILAWFAPEGRKNFEAYARQLLTTKNPYTGLSLADDPALITVGLINENPRIATFEELKYPNSDPFWNKVFKGPFEQWCARKGIPATDKPDRTTWAHFMMDSHTESFTHFRDFLRTLGVTVPVSDISSSKNLILAVPRNNFDYVDVHYYHDHPEVAEGFKFPYVYTNTSSLETFELPLQSSSARILGRPMMMTELHYCAPNSFRAEGGAATGAYCALQNINGIFDFNTVAFERSWGDPVSGKRRVLGCFSVFDDPLALLNTYVTALLYARGDVKPATMEFTLNVSPKIYANDNALDYVNWGRRANAAVPEEFYRLGVVGKVGIRISEEPSGKNTFTNDAIVAARKNNPSALLEQLGLIKNGEITSSTGQLRLNPQKKRLSVVTDKSEALVQEERTNRGNALTVGNNTTFSTVFAGSIDNQPLQNSRRVLLLHLTDVKPGDGKYTIAGDKLIQHNWGKYPYLLRRGKVDITLKNTASGKALLYALDMTGKRIKAMPFTEKNGTIIFTADNDQGEFSPPAYELVRE